MGPARGHLRRILGTGPHQDVLAETQPALFGWHHARLDAASKSLRSRDGQLDLDLARWFAPERLVLETSGS